MKIRITENQRILLLTESKIDDILARYGEKLKPNFDLENVKEVLMNTDPSPTKKYSEWIVKNIFLQNKNKRDILEDLVTTHDYILRFDELANKNQIKDKDINFYKNFNDLKIAVSEAEQMKSRRELVGEYEKVYEDSEYLMVKPLTEEASCRFGVDTKWCISAKRDNRFGQYVGKGENEFYFIIKKGVGRGKLNRVAVQITNYGRITLWNSEDRVESTNLLGIYPDGISHFILKKSEELRPKDCYNLSTIESIYLGKLGEFRLTNANSENHLIATYVSEEEKDNTYILLKVTKEENNSVKFTLYYHIGFENYRIDSLILQCNTPKKLIQIFEERVNIYQNILFKIIERIKFKHENKDLAFWGSSNVSSTYSFKKPGSSKLAEKFINYIKEQNSKNEPATRKDFLIKNYGHANRGFLTTFFSSIKDAGIVKIDKNFNYSIGPNYEKYLQGKLRRD